MRLNSIPAALAPELAGKNLFPNNFVLFLPAKGSTRVIAFLVGYSYASSPGSLDAIELSPGGDAKLILHRENMELIGLEDLDKDGASEMVGDPCDAQVWGKNDAIESYAPTQVYKFSSTPGGRASLSLELSRLYNVKYRYGWAGPDCREDVVVVHYPTGSKKVQIMKSSDAERLVNGESAKEHN